jgi:hypothetical protein
MSVANVIGAGFQKCRPTTIGNKKKHTTKKTSDACRRVVLFNWLCSTLVLLVFEACCDLQKKNLYGWLALCTQWQSSHQLCFMITIFSREALGKMVRNSS